MVQNDKINRPDEVGVLEVEPLTDSDLESMAEGVDDPIESNVANACCRCEDVGRNRA